MDRDNEIAEHLEEVKVQKSEENNLHPKRKQNELDIMKEQFVDTENVEF